MDEHRVARDVEADISEQAHAGTDVDGVMVGEEAHGFGAEADPGRGESFNWNKGGGACSGEAGEKSATIHFETHWLRVDDAHRCPQLTNSAAWVADQTEVLPQSLGRFFVRHYFFVQACDGATTIAASSCGS